MTISYGAANAQVIVSSPDLEEQIRRYWNDHIHDLEITSHPAGSLGFFRDLEQYHFEKLHHLTRLVPYAGYSGRCVLDIGCGAGTDLVRFARGGAVVTGVDIAESAIALAERNFSMENLSADLRVAPGEHLPFPTESFDLVFAHGVLQYAADDRAIVSEAWRVLKQGGLAIFQVYNRRSWLNLLSRVMRVPLEHEDAPVIRRYSTGEFRALLDRFERAHIVPERFPVRSRLHKGWKGALYNGLFVGTFNLLPLILVRRFGWHLLAFCTK